MRSFAVFLSLAFYGFLAFRPEAGAIAQDADSSKVVAPQADWTQWGGSNARMNTPIGRNIPTQWNAGELLGSDRKKGQKPVGSKNIKWAVKLGSETYGNPVVATARTGLFAIGGSDRNHFLGTPVLYKGLVYKGSGCQGESGEGPGRLVCIDPSKTGDISSELAVDRNGNPLPHRRTRAVNPTNGEVAVPNPNSGLIWEFTQQGEDSFQDVMHRTLSTVAIHDGLVIAPDFTGIVHCLDWKTGKKYWSYDAFASIWASPLIVGNSVYVADEDGGMAIFKLSPDPDIAMKKVTADYHPIAEIANDKWIYSSPIFANDTLYVATRNKLFAIAAPQALDKGSSNSSTIDPAVFRNSVAASGRVAKPIFSSTPQETHA